MRVHLKNSFGAELDVEGHREEVATAVQVLAPRILGLTLEETQVEALAQPKFIALRKGEVAVFEIDHTVKDEQYERIRYGWERYTGTRPVVLPAGVRLAGKIEPKASSGSPLSSRHCSPQSPRVRTRAAARPRSRRSPPVRVRTEAEIAAERQRVHRARSRKR